MLPKVQMSQYREEIIGGDGSTKSAPMGRKFGAI
jgi:hypothetical protein